MTIMMQISIVGAHLEGVLAWAAEVTGTAGMATVEVGSGSAGATTLLASPMEEASFAAEQGWALQMAAATCLGQVAGDAWALWAALWAEPLAPSERGWAVHAERVPSSSADVSVGGAAWELASASASASALRARNRIISIAEAPILLLCSQGVMPQFAARKGSKTSGDLALHSDGAQVLPECAAMYILHAARSDRVTVPLPVTTNDLLDAAGRADWTMAKLRNTLQADRDPDTDSGADPDLDLDPDL